MTANRRTLGQHAERLAVDHLQRRGYRILGQNVRVGRGELDVVAQDGDTLVFVEVKARRSSAYGGTPYAIDAAKQQRMIRLAAAYLAQRSQPAVRCRFDAVLCDGPNRHALTLTHIENAFEVSGEDLRW